MADWHLSPVIVKNLRPIEAYLYAQAKTKLKDMPKVVGELFHPMAAMLMQGELKTSGPGIFVYQDCTGDPETLFDLQMGFCVSAKSPAVIPYQLRRVEGCRAATAYYTGPRSGLAAASQRFYACLFENAMQPSHEYREVYLYWEDEHSDNNVVELQAILK